MFKNLPYQAFHNYFEILSIAENDKVVQVLKLTRLKKKQPVYGSIQFLAHCSFGLCSGMSMRVYLPALTNLG